VLRPAHVQGLGPSSRALIPKALPLSRERLRGLTFRVSHSTDRSPSPEPYPHAVLLTQAPPCAGVKLSGPRSTSGCCSRWKSGGPKPSTTLVVLCPSRLEPGDRHCGLPQWCPHGFLPPRSFRCGTAVPRGSFFAGRGDFSRSRRPPWALSPLVRLCLLACGSDPGLAFLLTGFARLSAGSPALRTDRRRPEFSGGGLSVRRIRGVSIGNYCRRRRVTPGGHTP
jgi:hypothetical protein